MPQDDAGFDMVDQGRQGSSAGGLTSPPIVVGVCAGEGGLEAFAQFLLALGDAANLAIIFYQHLSANEDASACSQLATTASLQIVSAQERLKLKSGSIYFCPPGLKLEVDNDVLCASEYGSDAGPATDIDHFLCTLAEGGSEFVVGVILSGSGSDGTLGLKAIRDRGGLTFAQEPTTAKFDSLPRLAVTMGVADHVLPPSELAVELKSYAQHVLKPNDETSSKIRQAEIEEAIPAIAECLHRVTKHNFRHYKVSTLQRRIQRRMQLLKIETAAEYLAHLENHRSEAHALFRELLIGVTSFFRDPEAFRSLAHSVLPQLFRARSSEDCVRIWVAGCATGEEAYTLAILCRETMDQFSTPPQVQIFATDIDLTALKFAREGIYPGGIEDHISAARLARFFFKRGTTYQVAKEIRDMVLFSVHNLISDPPFSRQDLISCRNLLIYLGPHLQQMLIPLFHYALRPAGFLFLGSSESIASHGELFRPVVAKLRISQRKGRASPAQNFALGISYRPHAESGLRCERDSADSSVDLTAMMQKIALDEFMPETVVIDHGGQVLTSSSNVQKYLSINGGPFRNNIIRMVDRGLRIGLRAAISEAKRTCRRVRHENLSIRDGDLIQRVMLTVQPMPKLGSHEELLLVVFHDVGLPIHRDAIDMTTISTGEDADSIIAQLERELEITRNDLEQTMQDMEAANEELKSSNEELLSMNEELQSANEELQTSKEEIRAGSDALARLNSDLENLLRSTQIATIFLDENRLIRSFTSAATEIYGLLPTDIGRPLEHFVPLVVEMPPLPDLRVLDNDELTEHMVLARSGKAYIRRVLPYRSQEKRPEGIVVTFTDVTELRESEDLLRRSLDAACMYAFQVDLLNMQVFRKGALVGCLDLPEHGLADACYARVHRDDRVLLDAALSKVSLQQPTYSFTYRFETREGDYLWLRDEGEVLFDEAQQPVRRVGSCRDVTLEKLSQLELESRERQLRTITDALPALISYVDTNQCYRFVNSAYTMEWGQPADELIGQRVADVLGHSNYSEILPRLTAALEGQSQKFELQLRLPSTNQTRVMEVSYIPDLDSAQRVLGCHVLSIDITERKGLEIDLADREAHLRRVVNNILGFVGVLAAEGTLLEVSQSALAMGGLSREDVVGRKLWDCGWFAHDEQLRQMIEMDIADACAGKTIHRDVLMSSVANQKVDVDFMLVPVEDAKGNVTHLIASGTDVTERKCRESKLAFLMDLQTQFNTGALVDEIMHFTCRRLVDRLGLAHCGLAEIDEHAEEINFFYECRAREDIPSLVGPHRITAFHTEAERQQILVRQPVTVCDINQNGNGPLVNKCLEGLGIGALVSVPCGNQGRVNLLLCASKCRAYDWRGDEVQLLEEVASRLYSYLERAQTEQQLAESEAKLRAIFDGTAHYAGLMRPDGILIEANRSSLEFGNLCRDEVVGKLFWNTPWFAGAPSAIRAVRRAVMSAANGEFVRFEAPVTTFNGETRWLDLSFSPVRNAHGEIVYIVPEGRDISARICVERQLAETNQRLAIAMAAARMGAFEWEPESDAASWDDGLSKIAGILTDAPQQGRLFMDLVHPDDRSAFEHATRQAIDDTGIYANEYRIVRADGRIRWLAGRGIFLPAADGQAARLVGLNWDITEQKEQEQRIRASEERLRLAMSAAQLALWQWDITTDDIQWSDELQEYTGINLSQSIGRFDRFIQLVHKDDRAQVQKAMQYSLETGSPYRAEFRLRREDGSYRWVLSMAQLCVEAGNGSLRMLGVELDITARKQAELAIQLNEERLRNAALAAGFGMLYIDLRAGKITFSRELNRLVGRDEDADVTLRVGDVPDFVHPEDQESFEAYLRQSLLVPEMNGATVDHRILRPDGEVRWMRLQTKALFAKPSDAEPQQMIGTLLDITRQREFELSLEEAREQAEAANASKSQFLANMSHEIRTPMTVIMGYTDLVAEKVQDPESKEHLQTIKRNSEFLLDIINDILDLSKIEAGKFEIIRQRFSLRKLIDEVRVIMEARAAESNLSLTVEYPGQVPENIESDPKRLKQILFNLLGNAIKFTNQGSVKVVVEPLLSASKSMLQLQIIDSGIGISEQQQRHLFLPFSQGDTSVSRRFGGTGLGLAISQRLAKMLGGNITVQSELGKGSTFTVRVAAGELTGADLLKTPCSVKASANSDDSIPIRLNCHVLVVDDRREIRMLTKRLLTQAGATVSEAVDGEQCVELVRQSIQQGVAFDILLLDMQMPRLDGYETALTLRELGYTGPIIALTADAMQGDMNRCLECGCNDYLSKPIDKRKMLQKMDSYLKA